MPAVSAFQRARLFQDSREERYQVINILERSQSRGVRRRDVDRNIVGDRENRPQAGDVIVNSAVEWGDGVLANVDSDDARGPAGAQAGDHALGAVVGKPHPVDDALMIRDTEHARSGVAGLGFRSDRPDLHMSEAEREPAVDRQPILVEAGRKAHTILEREAKRLHRRTALPRRWFEPAERADHIECQGVRLLRRKAKESGACNRIDHGGEYRSTPMSAGRLADLPHPHGGHMRAAQPIRPQAPFDLDRVPFAQTQVA